MDKNESMSVVLEQFIISKASEMQQRNTSPEEISALAELVQAVNNVPRLTPTLKK